MTFCDGESILMFYMFFYLFFDSWTPWFYFVQSINSAQSTARIEELLMEDQNVKRKRERYQKQSSILSKLTRVLSIHDNRAAAAASMSNGGTAGKS